MFGQWCSLPPVRGSGKSLEGNLWASGRWGGPCRHSSVSALHTPKALKRLFISCFFAEGHVKLFC